MSSKELKKKIQEQFKTCEQQLIKAIEHTKKRIIENLELFQKEKLNAINKSFLSLVSQLKHTDHDKKFEHHILSSVNKMNEKFPEFQKILKAQIRIPLRESMRKIDFDLPKMEILPVNFNLQHKKSLVSQSVHMSENQAINCVTSLPNNKIVAVVNTKIKVLDVNQEKIMASVVAHSEKITSLNFFNIKRLVNTQDTISLSQKMKQQKKVNRKHSMNSNKSNQNEGNRPHSFSAEGVQELSNNIENPSTINNENQKKIVQDSVLISTSLDKRVQIMNIGDFSLINTLKLNKQSHNTLQLNEREILIQYIDGFSIFTDMEKKIGEFKYTQPILKCAYSDLYKMVILHTKNKITVINRRNLRIISTYPGPSESFFMKVLENQILIIHSNGIVVQDLIQGKVDKHKQLNLQSPICSLTDLLDNSHVAVITLKNEVAIIDYQNMKILSTLNLGGKSGARSITYMNDGQNFAINTVDNKIKLWTFSKD